MLQEYEGFRVDFEMPGVGRACLCIELGGLASSPGFLLGSVATGEH